MLSHSLFGRLGDGRPVHEYVLDNGLGLCLRVLDYGGIVRELWAPDAAGRSANLVLGFDALDDYLARNPYFGVIVGRYANRIAGGRFELDGQTHTLPANDGGHCLHGGAAGFGCQLWNAAPDTPREGETVALLLRHRSPQGDQGFPGTLDVSARYALSATENTWRIDYQAHTDRPTVVNLSHHGYFNLAGQGSIEGHELMLPASRYTEVDASLIPLGHAAVDGTPFDFRRATTNGSRLRQPHPQLLRAKGYDHNWLLDAPADGSLRLAAHVHEPTSGRTLELHSSEPCLQFYSGNFLDGSLSDGRRVFRQGDGLCLETQHAPDSPNHAPAPDWPSSVLRPGQTYRSSTLHRFGVRA
jgi:aldose 1-epimerase